MRSSRGCARRSTHGWGGQVCRRTATVGCCWWGYFEGLDSERAIVWRAELLGLRSFSASGVSARPLDELATRRLLSLEQPHERRSSPRCGSSCPTRASAARQMGLDATTLANAALRHRSSRPGRGLHGSRPRLADASGIATPTRADLAGFDRPAGARRKRRTPNGPAPMIRMRGSRR